MYLVIAHVMVFMKNVTEAKGGKGTQRAEARCYTNTFYLFWARNESAKE